MDTRTDEMDGHIPRICEVECVDGGMVVDVAEDEYLATNTMVVDTPGTLIQGDEVNGARVDTEDADRLPGIVGEETMKIVSKETIKEFVGGKKAKVGTKTKDIDDYLKLFINAHHLPRNTHCRRVHSNFFFSNHSLYSVQHSSSSCSLIFQWSSTHRKTAVRGVCP